MPKVVATGGSLFPNCGLKFPSFDFLLSKTVFNELIVQRSRITEVL